MEFSILDQENSLVRQELHLKQQVDYLRADIGLHFAMNTKILMLFIFWFVTITHVFFISKYDEQIIALTIQIIITISI